MKHVIKWRMKLYAAATYCYFGTYSLRSLIFLSSCYVTAPLAMYIKSETVGGGGCGEDNKKQVSALIWDAYAVGSCFHTSCFRTPTRVIFTEMAAKNAYFPCV